MSLFYFNKLSLGEIREELMRHFASNLLVYLVEFDLLETM